MASTLRPALHAASLVQRLGGLRRRVPTASEDVDMRRARRL
jgi:hypothetical protein